MKNISTFLKGQVDSHKTPSIQYAFFDTDDIICELSHGLRNVKTMEKVDASTTYNLFSITKTFTALSILQLVQKGKIELWKPISDYLPQSSYSKQITVEQLLRHTSGIPNPLPLKWIHLAEEHQDFDGDKFFREIFEENPKLDFEPGTDFKYSNLGYVILGQLIEKMSGQDFEDYIKDHIILPCNIDPSALGFQINPALHAIGYHKWWSLSNAILELLIDKEKYMGKKESAWKPFHTFYNNGTAYGGMIGSRSGLIKYAQALLRKNSILLMDHYKEMLFSERSINNKSTGMSLSWFIGSLKGHRYYAHAGGGGGYYTELRLYPELGVGSVILYNRSGMTDERSLSQTDGFFITEKTNSFEYQRSLGFKKNFAMQSGRLSKVSY